MRINGFYWIDFEGHWEIGEYADGLWFLSGCESTFFDKDFIKINETKLIEPDED